MFNDTAACAPAAPDKKTAGQCPRAPERLFKFLQIHMVGTSLMQPVKTIYDHSRPR